MENNNYSDEKDRPNIYTREWLEEKVAEFLKTKQIKVLPPCVFSMDAEPMSVIRRRIEKTKNFGDDIKT